MAILRATQEPALGATTTAYRIDLIFPAVGEETEGAPPTACPHCGCRGFHRHQRTPKRIKDQRCQSVASMRYLCKGCGRSIRLYPPGVSARRQSEATRGLSVVLYRLGLSYRNIQRVLTDWRCPLGAATIWQNVHSLGAAERSLVRRGGRITIETDTPAGRATYPADGPTARLRLVSDPEGMMRLEIRIRDDWRSVWRRIETPGLSQIGVRLIGAKPLLARPQTARAASEAG